MSISHLDRSAQAGHEAADRRSSRLLFSISIPISYFDHKSYIFPARRLRETPPCWLSSNATVWHLRWRARVQPQSKGHCSFFFVCDVWCRSCSDGRLLRHDQRHVDQSPISGEPASGLAARVRVRLEIG